MVPRLVVPQDCNRSGSVGRAADALANQHNPELGAIVLEALAPTLADRVLEVGFGSGALLADLAGRADFVGGVDRSATMIDCARKRFAAAIAQGRMELREGRAEALPFGARSFDKACTVNTIYFWQSLEAGFDELGRVLRPRGRLVVGFLPKEPMARLNLPANVFALREPAEVLAALARTGFADAAIVPVAVRTGWCVAVASAPTAMRAQTASPVAEPREKRLLAANRWRTSPLLEDLALQQT